ncbi:MAG: cell wall hydrolase [Rhodospirillales bacterium]|nr:MAG: cell wall hydrolase [Rhodospirillales bacterium]
MGSAIRTIRRRRLERYAAWAGTARAGLSRVVAGLALLFVSGAEAGLHREIGCLALNIYFEARFEPEAGRRAVAHVVLNRVADRRWPDTPCRVIADGFPDAGALCQFSWYCDGKSNRPKRDRQWRDAQQLARGVYWGRGHDPTGGALWYHADYVDPGWRYALRRGPQIGRHIFYHDGAVPEHPPPRVRAADP